MDTNLEFNFSIDRGGTFTDIYCEIYNKSTQKTENYITKLLSVDTQNYKDAPTEGIRRTLEKYTDQEYPKEKPINSDLIKSVRMGTTVATNALLERKGDRMALVITKGFRDLLHIGNQSRPKIFDLVLRKPEKLYECIVEVNERVRLVKEGEEVKDKVESVTGEAIEVIEELDEAKVREDLQKVLDQGIKSIAVVLLHSYTFRDHEDRIGNIAKELGFEQISLSSKIMPRIKIVNRGDTSCVDAYLNPHIHRYLQNFIKGFDDKFLDHVNLFFMQSDGGLAPVHSFTGSKAILSGPAGGVVGYAVTTYFSQEEEKKRPVIGFDMGGTSTDVSRFEGFYEHIFETEIACVRIQAPQLDINTVAAGGGSRLFFKNGLFKVGPESSGADPGPVCYRKNGHLSITDANVLLGRILPEYFPKIFGKSEKEPLDLDATKEAFAQITSEINSHDKSRNLSMYEVAYGFLKVANESMCRPIRALTQARGHNPRNHILSIFGGAGGQHACAIARSLGIEHIFIHKYCGILSAFGIGLADVVQESEEPTNADYSETSFDEFKPMIDKISNKNAQSLKSLGFKDEHIEHYSYFNMRYEGSDYAIMVMKPSDNDFKKAFEATHKREYGFNLNERIVKIDNVRVRSVGKSKIVHTDKIQKKQDQPKIVTTAKVHFEVQEKIEEIDTPVYDLLDLGAGSKVEGPAIILNNTSTIVIEPNCSSEIDNEGNLHITLNSSESIKSAKEYSKIEEVPLDQIELSIFAHRFMGIAEQMGITLQRTSVSTNIKERLDFSCAIFGPDGSLVANAPHLPVHLGSMQDAVKFQINHLGSDWKEGEVLLSNHPKAGGTHLPDMTVITPVFKHGKAVFYVASKGHHADIGGITPGSMPPFSKLLEEEGASFVSFKIVKDGKFQEEDLKKSMTQQSGTNTKIAGTRNLKDNISDFQAQVAANNKGIGLISDLIDEYSLVYVQAYMHFIQANAESSVRQMLQKISKEHELEDIDTICSEDFMDDGSRLRLTLTINKNEGSAIFDFEGTSYEMYGNCNAPKAITNSAIIYCLRCLVNAEVPLNQGFLTPIAIKIPDNSFLSPSDTAAVVGGNVLTSQRLTDVILKAFKACAASQGCMNNLTFGTEDWGYYETIAGGAGAGHSWNGQSGIHTHMTNTRITDPEILEKRYPVLLRQFSLRAGSGGEGKYNGGDGVIREIEFLVQTEVSILSERRVYAPYGMDGGKDGKCGRNTLILPDGRKLNLGSKNSAIVEPHTKVLIESPGGGGYGKIEDRDEETTKRIEEEIIREFGSVNQYKRIQESA